MAAIVVGVDGSNESKSALRFALEEARLRGAELRVVHAWYYSVGLGAELVWNPAPESEEELARERELWLEEIVREVAEDAPDVKTTLSAVEGTAPGVLLDAAKDADLLVVGSRGHGGFVGLLLGSVSQQCAHHAPCPVLIVRE